MARRPTLGGRPGGAYNPDWSEEKLNALRAALGGDKLEQLDDDLRRHGINLPPIPQYEEDGDDGDDGDDFELSNEDEEDLNVKVLISTEI